MENFTLSWIVLIASTIAAYPVLGDQHSVTLGTRSALVGVAQQGAVDVKTRVSEIEDQIIKGIDKAMTRLKNGGVSTPSLWRINSTRLYLKHGDGLVNLAHYLARQIEINWEDARKRGLLLETHRKAMDAINQITFELQIGLMKCDSASPYEDLIDLIRGNPQLR